MNQQHYSISSEPLVKRRRGRPRKEDSLPRLSKLTPIMPPPQNSMSSDLSKGKALLQDVNSNGGGIREDEMIGQAVTGVLEGMFDAGYFLSVRVGETDTRLKGLVFQPGKFVPVTEDNDIAPGAKMYSRINFANLVLKSDYSVNISDKERNLTAIVPTEKMMVEKSSIVLMDDNSKEDEDVAKQGFMECEGFVSKEGGEPTIEMEAANGDEETVAIHMSNNDVLEQKQGPSEMEMAPIGFQKVVEVGYMNEHFGSPSLELALSNSSFEIPIDIPKPDVERNLEADEGQQNIPLQNLDPCLGSSLNMKDVLKISIDQSNEPPPVIIPSFCLFEEIESGREDAVLDPIAKKQKMDENVASSDVIQLDTKEVDSQGFVNLMETD